MAHKQLDNFSCEANRKNGSTAAVDTDITWHDIDRPDPQKSQSAVLPASQGQANAKAESSSDWNECRI